MKQHVYSALRLKARDIETPNKTLMILHYVLSCKLGLPTVIHPVTIPTGTKRKLSNTTCAACTLIPYGGV